MPRIVIGIMALLFVAGCGSSRKSSLLLERYSRGTMDQQPAAGQTVSWRLDPAMQKAEQRSVAVDVTYASPEFLQNFFSNRKVFKEFAGQNPYFPEHLVFYVTIKNSSRQRLRLSPGEFVLVDSTGSQYSPLNVDYVTAFAEFRAPMSTVTRGMLEDASPGYFGFSVPVGKMVSGKPQGRFALIQQSSLQTGYLYPTVVHDGLIAFWNPSREAASMRLILPGIKTDFDANDWPQTSLEFTFDFQTVAR